MTTPPEPDDELLTVEQALAILRFSYNTLQRRIRQGRITPANVNPALDRPKALLFRRADVERLLREGRRPPSAPAPQDH